MDLISRQAAIEAIRADKIIITPELKPLYDSLKMTSRAADYNAACNKNIILLKSLPPAQQWIPVTERLPEPGQWVIATYERTYSDTGGTRRLVVDTIYSARKGWDDTPGIRRTVAWMPMPEPFKEVE